MYLFYCYVFIILLGQKYICMLKERNDLIEVNVIYILVELHIVPMSMTVYFKMLSSRGQSALFIK